MVNIRYKVIIPCTHRFEIMISHIIYFSTLQAITNGKIIDHQLCSLQEFQRMRENTKPLWEKKFPHVPFEFHDVNSYKELNPPENSKSSPTGTSYYNCLENLSFWRYNCKSY